MFLQRVTTQRRPCHSTAVWKLYYNSKLVTHDYFYMLLMRPPILMRTAYRPIGKEPIVPLFQSTRSSQAESNGLSDIQITTTPEGLVITRLKHMSGPKWVGVG